MACTLSVGRKVPCKDTVGGIKGVYFFDFGSITAAFDSTDVDVIEDLGAVTCFNYEVKGNSGFEQAITSSRENGTTFYEQTLNLTLTKLTVQDHKELRILSVARPHVVIEDYNGNAFIMGLEHGADVSGGTIVTGAAMGDMSGYTLTLSAQEKKPANFLEGATAANPFAGMTNTVTVTEGTNT